MGRPGRHIRVTTMDKDGQNTQDVITMTQFVTQNGFSPLAQVEAYWEALRGSRMMPNRVEIDPRGIESALEYAFIVERIAPGIARLRIAGSHLSDLMGMEVRGIPLTSFITPNSRRQLSDLMEEVFEIPAVATLRLHAPASAGAPELEARLVMMPLKSDLGDVSRILGAFVAVGEIGRSPRRFEIVGSSTRPIRAGADATRPEHLKPAAPAPGKPVAPKAQIPGFAEATSQFDSRRPPRAKPGRSHLRLVKSDD